jgi:hypothetical protein
MSKRKVDEVQVGVFDTAPKEEDAYVQRARELYSEKSDKVVRVFVCQASELKTIIKRDGSFPQPDKTIKLLRKHKDIHRVHPLVIKQKQILRFQFCPATLGKGGRCIARLTDVMNILPKNAGEVDNMQQLPGGQCFDPEHFVLHSFEATRSRNNSPLQLLLRSNMFDMSLEYLSRFQSGERMMRSISEREPFIMPDMPGDYGTLVLDPNSEKHYEKMEGVCVAMAGADSHLNPENTRVVLTTSDEANSNGVLWLDWRPPRTQQTSRFAVLRKDHVLTIAARANFDEHYIDLVALNDVQEKDEYFTLMPASLAKVLSDELVERHTGSAPVCDTERVVFELCRQIGGTDWTSARGAAGMTPEQLGQTYEAEIEFTMSYSLRNRDIGDAAVTMPSAAVPADAMNTGAELREAIDRHVAEQVDEELTMYDLEKLRLDNDE